jgi:molybdopterin-synthase adenylyltransferase
MSRELHFAVDEETHARLAALLLRNAPEEEVCFALVRPSDGVRRRTLIIGEILAPSDEERSVHGNVSFSAPFTNRAIDAAIDAGAGLLLIHSHPFGKGFQRPSPDDLVAEARTLETAYFALPGRPVAAAILAGDGTLSGREYAFPRPGARPRVTANVATRIVGPHLRMQFRDTKSAAGMSAAHASHVGMFGADGQALLGRLKVGIVGLGSVGALINFQLSRLGVGCIGGFDYDHIEKRNINRLPAYRVDAERHRTKLAVAEREATLAATCVGFQFEAHDVTIVEAEGARCALDYDILFSSADSHWSRQVLNALSYAHLIPVVDGGTGIHCAEDLTFQAASFRVQVAGPGRGCLACGGAFDPAEVGEEMAGLVLPHYAGKAGSAVGAPSVIALNMALAGMQVLRFMEVVLGIAGTRELARQRFDYTGGDVQLEVVRCAPGCGSTSILGRGDDVVLPTGVDPRAMKVRRVA